MSRFLTHRRRLGKSGRVIQGVETSGFMLRSNRKWFQEKPLSFSHTRPYRKPTQVGEMSILRRLRELGRRNSANWYRNFGKRYAPVAWSLYCDRAKGLQYTGGCDCLIKTQHS